MCEPGPFDAVNILVHWGLCEIDYRLNSVIVQREGERPHQTAREQWPIVYFTADGISNCGWTSLAFLKQAIASSTSPTIIAIPARESHSRPVFESAKTVFDNL